MSVRASGGGGGVRKGGADGVYDADVFHER